MPRARNRRNRPGSSKYRRIRARLGRDPRRVVREAHAQGTPLGTFAQTLSQLTGEPVSRRTLYRWMRTDSGGKQG